MPVNRLHKPDVTVRRLEEELGDNSLNALGALVLLATS
jgi:hypothetical protein